MIILLVIVGIIIVNFIYQYGKMIGRKRLADSIKPELEEAKAILRDIKNKQN